MDTYSFLRELADSWVLLAMFIFLMGVWVWAFWPGLNSHRADASMIPFRNETAPKAPCKNACENCACKSFDLNLKEARDV